MRKLLLVGVLLLMRCASPVQLTRPSSFQEVAVAAFDFEIEPFEKAKYEGKAGPTADLIEALGMIGEIKKTLKDIQHPEASAWKAQMDSLYGILAEGLQNELGLALLPLDQLREEVPRDHFGYPHGSATQLVRQGKYAAALEIRAHLAFTPIDTSSLDLVFWGKTHNVQLPKLALQVKMADRSGKIVWRERVNITSKTPVVVDEKWRFGIKYKKEQRGPALTELFQQAVDELVRETKKFQLY